MTTHFKQLRAHLTDGQDHRLWSLLVTVFGDIAPNQQDWISGVLLNQITAAVGLKPEATRVALHRLRKDDWIESRRTGRHSDSRLTPKGRAETHAACPRIYATQATLAPCHLWIAEPGTQHRPQGANIVWVTPDLAVTTTQRAPDGIASCTAPDPFPAWMKAKIADPRIGVLLAQTNGRFRALRSALDSGPVLSRFERMVLRIIVVHTWRRIALKLPVLPDATLPPGWPAAECRAHLAALLARLPKPNLAELEQSYLLSTG